MCDLITGVCKHCMFGSIDFESQSNGWLHGPLYIYMFYGCFLAMDMSKLFLYI